MIPSIKLRIVIRLVKGGAYIRVFILYNQSIIKMQQVDLLSQQAMKDSSDPRSISRQKRPPQISVSKVFSPNHKWRECKIIGKNISIRSYSAACAFKNKLYLYGGYQILAGSLHDFYSISLDQSQATFNWMQILPKGKSPGSRSKHALVSGTQRIFLIGGLLSNNQASNDIFSFDPNTSEWTLLKPSGAELPPLQSFGAVMVHSNDEERIIIAFGFNQKVASPSNAVYEYNVSKNKLSVLFQGTSYGNDNIPCPRIGSAITADKQNIYVFGGKSQASRLNDTWAFSLTDYKFRKLKDDGEIPYIRNGHTINHHQGKLYVFGGIHDVTWELDDLHIYDLKSQKWTTLEQQSPRKVQKKNNNPPQNHENKDKSMEKNSSKKKAFFETVSVGLNKMQSPTSSAGKNQFSLTAYGVEETINKGAESPGKMLDEQRKKVFYQKKAQMLKNFQITKQDKAKLIVLETSSQAMKNSLDVIGNPDPKFKNMDDKLTDFGKESHSKFLEPLHNNSNIVVGKKPCARDGHVSVVINDELIIFGGDRHQMSFNDIFKLNLKLANKELPPA